MPSRRADRRLRWLLAVGVGLLVAACSSPPAPEPGASAESATPPEAARAPRVENVLLVTVDTLRADVLGYAGGSARTPAIDRLAAAGWSFSRAHAHAVMTLPSHASILTGELPPAHGVRSNSGYRLQDKLRTLAERFADAGFETGAFVSAYPLDSRFGLDQGFSVYDDRIPATRGSDAPAIPERAGELTVRAALDWWEAHPGRPKLAWVHLFEPHIPYLPHGGPGESPHTPRQAYLGEVEQVDRALAPLLEPFLDGQRASTLIVFTADHGEALGEHGELTHGLFAYEPTLRVPLVLWAPDLPPQPEPDREARHVDLVPTILEAVGLPAPGDLPGASLWSPLPDGRDASTYFESLDPNLNRGWAPLRGTLEGGLKLIELPIPELYDLDHDPDESNNLFASDRDAARRLAASLPDESPWPPEPGRLDPEAESRLRTLGYLGGTSQRKASYTEEDDPKRLVELDRAMQETVESLGSGAYAEAERRARDLVARRPGMGVGHYLLAQALLGQDRLPEAIEVMSRALDAGVATPALRRQLGLSLLEAGRPTEAVALLGSFAESFPEIEYRLEYALALIEAGRGREARAVLQEVLASDPGNAEALQHLALLELKAGRWTEAEEAARRALGASGQLPEAWNYLGVALYNLGRPREALDAWDSARGLGPVDPDLLYNMGIVAFEIGATERARDALTAYLAHSTDSDAASRERARQLLRRLPGGPS